MEDFRTILKVEDNSSVKYTLNDLFSSLADEPEICPFVSENSTNFHYFLRFRSPVLSEDALNHRIDRNGVDILPVHQNSRLVEQYQHAFSHHLATSPLHIHSGLGYGFQEHNLIRHSHETEVFSTLSAAPNSYNATVGEDSSPEASVVRTNGAYTCSVSRLPLNSVVVPRVVELDSLDGLISKLLPKGPVATQRLPLSYGSPGTGIAVHSPECHSAYPEVSPITCKSKIYLTICGEIITFDLDWLNSDPQVIIDLLKATKSERGNYVIVAVFYRRTGHPESARSVLLSMLEEFSNRGVSCQQLHPIFLLLSGCELDLARQARNDGKQATIISGHYSAVRKWLQKVFGKARPTGKEKESYLERFSSSPPPRASRPDVEQLQREIEALRYQNVKQEAQLSELHSSKRKLQEDFCYERDARRKMQRKLEDTEKEREKARVMDRYALEHVKSEVLARKRAADSSR